jgi:hypothetical protein
MHLVRLPTSGYQPLKSLRSGTHASSRSPVNEREAGIRSPIQTIAHLGEVSCTNYNRLFLFLEPVDFLNRGR